MRAGADGFHQLTEDAIDLAMFQRERQLERIADAELDAVRVAQHVARDPLAVDPRAVAAVQILNDVGAVFRNDARVLARGAVVAQHQVVIRLAADQERQRFQRHSGTLAGGRQNQQRGGRQTACGIRIRRRTDI